MSRQDVVPPHLLQVAERLLPHASLDGARYDRGQFHDVVLLPDVAAVRIARDAETSAAMPRRIALLARLSGLLPFAVPEPLSGVVWVDGVAAVATSWLDGAAHLPHSGDPAQLGWMLDCLAAVDVRTLEDVLDVPHAYAGRQRWPDLMREEVLPRLPSSARDEAARRVDAALSLEPVEPRLVHGDLAGHNVHWAQGRVVGVLDWDLASAWDPAVDVACLAVWHGWEAVGTAVDARTLARARTWAAVFGVEQIGSAVMHGEDEETVQRYVERAVPGLSTPSP